MTTQTDFAAIAALDLDRIKTKLCHVESGEGWSRARADAAEVEYRRFLYLMKAYPTEQTVPSVEVDTFWHYHILDTVKYAADCHAAFGYFLHHDPAVGLEGASNAADRDRGAARMDALYAMHFGAPDGAAPDNAYCGRTGGVSYCGRTSGVSYCGRTTGVQAGAATASYCGRTGGISYCGRTTGVHAVEATPSYCGRSTVSYCGAAIAAAARPHGMVPAHA